MYTDKQTLYESFLSRGFDDACARLMAGLDPATVMEAKDPYEKAQKLIEKKKKEIEGEYNRRTRGFKEKVNKLKEDINKEYEELYKIVENYRSEGGKSDNKNETDKSLVTHEHEEGYKAGSSRSEGSNERVEEEEKTRKLNTAKKMSPEEQNRVDEMDERVAEIVNAGPEKVQLVTDSVNLSEAIIELDEEEYNKNKNNGTNSKQETPEQKKPDEQSKEAQEGDKQKQQNTDTQQANGSGEKNGTDAAQNTETKNNALSDKELAKLAIKMKTMSNDEKNKIWNGMTKEEKRRFSEIREKIQSGEYDRERDNNSSEGNAPNNAEPNADKQSGSGNQNETDKSTTSETEEGYNAGSPESGDGSTEQEQHGNSNQGKSGNQNTTEHGTKKDKEQLEESFPPADYRIGNGETVGELVKDIKANTYELLQNAVEIAKVEAWSLWRIREVALLQDHATEEALEAEMENYSEVSERVIYQLMFGSNGRGTRLDVFRIKQFRDIN